MKDIVIKVVTNPAFIGGTYGAMVGALNGFIIAEEENKPKWPTVRKYLSIGTLAGSGMACIVDSCNAQSAVSVK